MRATHTAYDEIAYPPYSYPQTHPDRLATLARLYGLTPPPVDRCLVLELGSGNGSNLIPMALELPDSRFLGIDVASTSISRGRRQISQLHLSNIHIEQMDVLDFPDHLGPFDYIIAHGLYSWVPRAVQEKIFDIIEKSLSPQGVAYVSYNTLPGGYLRLMLRDMLLYHCERFESPLQKIEQARSFMELVAKSQTNPNRYGSLLQQERENITSRSPQVFFHDELAECNSNVYFHQFIAQAADHRLQFLSEADLRDMQPTNIAPSAVALLQRLGLETIVGQQYLDFFLGRRFRQTLLCRNSVLIDRKVTVDRIVNLLVAGNAQPAASSPPDASESEVTFNGAGSGEDDRASITTSHPLMKAALVCLADTWPLPISFEELWRVAHDLLFMWRSPQPFDSLNDHNCLAKMLFVCYQAGLVELHSWRPRMTPKPGERPLASPLARLQSLEGDLITTMRHDQVWLHQALNKELLQLLDGTRDRSAILRDLQQATLAGQVSKASDSDTASDALYLIEMLNDSLDRRLDDLARLGLLIS
jgi:cyclopropane fatty-acyl-phospholipid synthase-like methyltransferase